MKEILKKTVNVLKKHDKQKEKEILRKKKLANKKKIINKICDTKEGVEFFKILKDMCGFDKFLLFTENNGAYYKELVLMNEYRRALYLELRNFLDKENIIKIELDKTKL